MSRHHNTRHPDRGRSRYPDRLTRRGLSRAPEMESPDNLRTRQEARIRRTGVPWATSASDERETS
jgi:hypothetical protein